MGLPIPFSIAALMLGFFLFWLLQKIRLGSFQKIAEDILITAQKDGDLLRTKTEEELKHKKIELQKEWDIQLLQHQKKLLKEEERLAQREDRLDARLQLLEKKISEYEKKDQQLKNKQEALELEKKDIEERKIELWNKLQQLAQFSAEEAKNVIFQKVTQQAEADAELYAHKIYKETREMADKEACRIIASTISRLTIPCVSDHCLTTVSLPSDDIKGRIIGREGRNIKALELATGVNIIVDETPNAIVISGFDPIRKHLAKLTLQELINDGRIHPSRIEEVVKKHELAIEKEIKFRGEDAAIQVGILNLHPEIRILLGKLHFRHSFGQNILEHSIEVSTIMGVMAAELGLNISLAKRIGLLHDMGKALSAKLEGSHAIVGHDFALKFGESPEVANGIGCHHQEMLPKTIVASLCSSADSISGGRPGARIEAVDLYFKRLQRLEEISSHYPGVEKAYAMQAGREVRVIVLPDIIDDQGTIHLARTIAKDIEQELNYQGKIKVTVIREKRSIEYAI